MLEVNGHGEYGIDIDRKSVGRLNGRVSLSGSTGKLKIGPGCHSYGLDIVIGDCCEVIIGSDCNLSGIDIYTKKNSIVQIGNDTGFTHFTQILCHEPFDITIGSNCVFASGTIVTTSDMHSIIDLHSRELLNRGGPIRIGNRVWVGQDVLILKNAQVGDGSILGARSVVSRAIEQNVLAIGVPARAIRRDVTWDFRNPADYTAM